MRVTKVEIPAENPFGLKAISMNRLGAVVVLAGKNGAGKSRLLRRLSKWADVDTTNRNRHNFKKVMLSSNERWSREAISNFLGAIPPSEIVMTFWDRQQEWVEEFYDVEFSGDENPRIVPFVPKVVDFQDPAGLTHRNFSQAARGRYSVGVGHLHESALVWVQYLQDRWWNATHSHTTASGEEREEAVKAYERLEVLVNRLLSTSLGRNLEGRATLFGFPIGTAPLSDGQNILLQFCVAVHAQADSLSELIVLMDEPENHLHPGAMLDAIEQIQGALTEGQLWIATHSVPLLAHFDPDQIWWMHDGGIEHAGSIPEKVLESLLGDEKRIGRLNDFLGLPAVLAANNFAFQCLLPPTVVNTGPNDPQTLQVGRLLEARGAGQTLRMLDFGAGRGRLISALRAGATSTEDLKQRIDYRAYDMDRTHHADCEAAIARVYESETNRLFHERKDILAALDAGSVDVAVMCNVLHEIDVTEWLSVFSKTSLLSSLLKTDGFLLIVEDTEMRIGERPHQHGFLVLDTAGLKTLFQIAENEAGFTFDRRSDGRLQAHLIPARCLGRVTRETLVRTLQQVREFAMDQIKLLRNQVPSYRQGRRHAFHVQQLANAQLALNTLGE